jgi:hypothetical protein
MQMDGDSWFHLGKKAAAVWKLVATEAVGSAIEEGIKSHRAGEKKRRAKAKKDGQISPDAVIEDVGHNSEMEE